jgi:hypothetical protein
MQAVEVEMVRRAESNPSSAESVVEVPVLLESGLLSALEAAACERGMSAGRIVRNLIRDFLSSSDSNG